MHAYAKSPDLDAWIARRHGLPAQRSARWACVAYEYRLVARPSSEKHELRRSAEIRPSSPAKGWSRLLPNSAFPLSFCVNRVRAGPRGSSRRLEAPTAGTRSISWAPGVILAVAYPEGKSADPQ